MSVWRLLVFSGRHTVLNPGWQIFEFLRDFPLSKRRHCRHCRRRLPIVPLDTRGFGRFWVKNLPWPVPGVWPALKTRSPPGLQTDTPRERVFRCRAGSKARLLQGGRGRGVQEAARRPRVFGAVPKVRPHDDKAIPSVGRFSEGIAFSEFIDIY